MMEFKHYFGPFNIWDVIVIKLKNDAWLMIAGLCYP